MSEHHEQYQHETEEAVNAEAAQAPNTEQPEATEPPTYEELQARIAELEGQLKDSELRGLANEQNLRRRHQQEIALLDQSGNFDALKMGVQMTLNELQKAFDATHIKEINPQPGDKLDPHQHQAMQAVVSEQEPNTIVSVMKKGYTLSDRVLRPAMVVVAKKED